MSKRSSAHTNAQRQGRMRDYGTCQLCGSKNHPEGHHAMDYQFGGLPKVSNIVTLCRDCHKKVHRGEVDIKVL